MLLPFQKTSGADPPVARENYTQVKVWATRSDRVQHYKRKRLESPGRKGGNGKGLNGRNGKEKEFIDRKGVLAGKVEGLYSRKERGMFKKERTQSVREGSY